MSHFILFYFILICRLLFYDVSSIGLKMPHYTQSLEGPDPILSGGPLSTLKAPAVCSLVGLAPHPSWKTYQGVGTRAQVEKLAPNPRWCHQSEGTAFCCAWSDELGNKSSRIAGAVALRTGPVVKLSHAAKGRHDEEPFYTVTKNKFKLNNC